MFENFDDAFEIVEHPQAKTGEYAIRFRRDPYAGIVIQVTSFALEDIGKEDEMKMTFDYDILESSIPAETLELEPEFARLISGVVLNMYERTATLEPLETVMETIREDGGDTDTEIIFDVAEIKPHGEVVNE